MAHGLASGAYKKAAGLAKRVLELDPSNSRVRSVVGQAHLSHARKQLKACNPAGARRELEEASQWLRGAGERGHLKLLQGIAAGTKETADRLLNEGLAEFGASLVGAFQLALEARRTGANAAELLRRTRLELDATPPPEQVVALAHALNAVPA